MSWNNILQEKNFLVFGILNVTPDSFSDGGKFSNQDSINDQILKLKFEGADVIDVGGESTRPGAKEVSPDEEINRLTPVFEIMKDATDISIPFSIDTRHAQTAKVAVENGFRVINDVSGASFDEDMPKTMATTNSLVVIMHSRGVPETMNDLTEYKDVVSDVIDELGIRCDSLINAGVREENIMVDPGIGFAKTPHQNLQILNEISKIKESLGYPILVGVSRKTVTSFLLSGDTKKVPFEDRDAISAQIALDLKLHGVDAVRVHNVAMTNKILSQS